MLTLKMDPYLNGKGKTNNYTISFPKLNLFTIILASDGLFQCHYQKGRHQQGHHHKP